ncbi:MAG: hypothetical protein QM640_05135 [Niabella sp.]
MKTVFSVACILATLSAPAQQPLSPLLLKPMPFYRDSLSAKTKPFRPQIAKPKRPLCVYAPVINPHTLKKLNDQNMIATLYPDNMPCIIPADKGSMPNAFNNRQPVPKMPNLWQKDSI